MQLGMKHCGRFTDRRVGGPRAARGGGRAQLHPRDNPVRAPHSSQVSGFAAASSGARTGQGTETRRQAEEALPSQTPRGRWVRGTGTRGARLPRSPPRLRRPRMGPDPRSCSEGTDYSRPPGRRGATRTRSGPMGPAGLSLGAGEFLGVRRRQRLSCGWRNAPRSGSSPPQRGDAHRRRHTPRCHGQRATGRELGDSDNRP